MSVSYLSHVLRDLEDKTPLLQEQKQALVALQNNYKELLVRWNQFVEAKLPSEESEAVSVLHAEVLRLRGELCGMRECVEVLRKQRDALRARVLLKGGVSGVDVKEVDVKNVKEVDVKNVKEVEVKNVKEVEVKNVKEVDVKNVKEVDVKNVKEVDVKNVKEVEVKNVKEMNATEDETTRNHAMRLQHKVDELTRQIDTSESLRQIERTRCAELQQQVASLQRALAELQLHCDQAQLDRLSTEVTVVSTRGIHR